MMAPPVVRFSDSAEGAFALNAYVALVTFEDGTEIAVYLPRNAKAKGGPSEWEPAVMYRANELRRQGKNWGLLDD